MYTYAIAAHTLTQDGNLISTDGWAGQGIGLNNPDAVAVHNIGPLPPGSYTMGPAYHHPKLGSLTMNLTPAPTNEMYERSVFRIHGAAPMPNTPTSSEGCIIQRHEIRQRICDGSDRALTVIL